MSLVMDSIYVDKYGKHLGNISKPVIIQYNSRTLQTPKSGGSNHLDQARLFARMRADSRWLGRGGGWRAAGFSMIQPDSA